mgnify:CR=1 FL=1
MAGSSSEERELRVALYPLLRLPAESEEATEALSFPAALEVRGATGRAIVYLLHE